MRENFFYSSHMWAVTLETNHDDFPSWRSHHCPATHDQSAQKQSKTATQNLQLQNQSSGKALIFFDASASSWLGKYVPSRLFIIFNWWIVLLPFEMFGWFTSFYKSIPFLTTISYKYKILSKAIWNYNESISYSGWMNNVSYLFQLLLVLCYIIAAIAIKIYFAITSWNKDQLRLSTTKMIQNQIQMQTVFLLLVTPKNNKHPFLQIFEQSSSNWNTTIFWRL